MVWNEAHQGRRPRYPNVMEQILGFLAGPGGVCYAPKDIENNMIFCWHNYFKGTIPALNLKSYSEVYDYVVNECGGVNPPCDVNQKAPMA